MDEVDLPLDVLGLYLERQVPGFRGPLDASRFSGGQSNPTYMLNAASGSYVLRRKPFGELLKSAHAVDREYRVMTALQGSGVPVPKTIHLCEDESVIGAVFFIMQHVEAQQFWAPSLPNVDNAGRTAIFDEMSRVLVALHSVDYEALGLADFGNTGNYFERQVARWTKQFRASQTEAMPAMDKLIDWLPANMPPDDRRSSLIHGDYRLDNMLFGADGYKAVALLDWELSTLGHPLADLAYQCMQLRMPADGVISGLTGIDRKALGIPTEQEYVERYCERAQLDGIPNWTFYLVFSFFRFAAILQGILKRALTGTAASDLAFQYGALAEPLADMAVELIDNG